MRLLVIGGVAAGLSAAARARRIDPSLEIVVLEKGADISYGACGLPYYLEGRVRRAEQLIVYTPEYFRKERNIAVRTGARVVSISHPRREVALDGAGGERVHYDKLVIATGARPRTADFEGATLPHVFTLHTLEDAERLKAYLRDKQPKQAVVIGAGYIGLEAADALRRNGLAVTVVEQGPHVLGRGDAELTKAVRERLERFRVELQLNTRITDVGIATIWRSWLPGCGPMSRSRRKPAWRWGAPARFAWTSTWRPTCRASTPRAIARKRCTWSRDGRPTFRWEPPPTRWDAWRAPTPRDGASASAGSWAPPS
jgi:NADH dehydrogenase FAD-containing subunit